VTDPPRRREVFRGNLIRVEVWSERYREIVRHPGACAVVPFTPAGDVLLVRQYRDAIGAQSLEIPAGTRDVAGEEAADCASREVLEETGYRVARLEALGSIHTSPGFLDERVELFVARVEPAGDPEERLEVVEMPLEEAVAAVREGRITDAKTAVGLLLADR
jgi:ADP-ribose pyrophosphatase